ncbi:MAG: hypothetical protein GX811_01180 [Lentisphaerae bacterium]|nr:hypothetical protein [Lentisphaerota bacterium]
MEINGIIARQIFEKNKAKHDFYVEESYVIQWMYPYLEPHGLIMKINKDPMASLSEEVVKNDREFWNWLTDRLMKDRRFTRDVVARKTFSKLRCAIAGVYAYRNMLEEAEYAYRQSITLYPMSPESTFRLSDIYLKMDQPDKALAIMEENKRNDPKNEKIDEFITQLTRIKKAGERISELQEIMKGPQTVDSVGYVLELMDIYRKMGRMGDFYQLSFQVLDNNQIHPSAYLETERMFLECNPVEYKLVARAFEVYLSREPGNPRIWVDMAAVRLVLNETEPAYEALAQAIKIGGAYIKDLVRQDRRFQTLFNTERFMKMTAPVQNRFLR